MSCLRAPRLEVSYCDELKTKFVLWDVNVSLANAIRRTVLADIPCCVMDECNCEIEINTSRFTNEILKHRVSCIPVRLPVVDATKYKITLDMVNDTDQIMHVTTEHLNLWTIDPTTTTVDPFSIADSYPSPPPILETTAAEHISIISPITLTRRVFPPSNITLMSTPAPSFIDICRLRPSFGPAVPGEQIKLSAKFTVSTAADNAVYNVVSKCTFSNTIDELAAKAAWQEEEKSAREKQMDAEHLNVHKKNFEILQFQRYFKRDSFDFEIESLGIYPVLKVVLMACETIIARLRDVQKHVESGTLIQIGAASILHDPRCFDIVMQKEGYTIGKILEYLMYDLYYEGRSGSKPLIYIGFVKPHPHAEESIIRLMFADTNVNLTANLAERPERAEPNADASNNSTSSSSASLQVTKSVVAEMLISSAVHGAKMFETIYAGFANKDPSLLTHPAREQTEKFVQSIEK